MRNLLRRPMASRGRAAILPTPLTHTPMKRRHIVFLAGLLSLASGCKDFLDVNTNPNAPQIVTANLYLPPMIHWMVTAPQYDGRFVGHYTQEWISTSTLTTPAQTWGRMGYDPSSDNGAEQWRDVYWSLGQNLVDMTTKAEAEERWDLLGVGQVLKAWGWQVTTDLHGEIVIKEAIDQSRFSFDYDTQEFAYGEIQRLLNEAIKNLQRTDGAVDQAYLAKGDKIYNGDRTKWVKLAYGMLAMNLNHYSNKAAYKPADVIAAVDKSFASNADDFLLTYPNTNNDDINFWGRTRNNITLYRQAQFTLNLMNGTQFGGVVDPRMTRMLSPSPDGQYRGLDINTGGGFGALTTDQQPNNPNGYPGTGGLQLPGRYLFDDKAKIPLVTYSQLQFIKAEAAYRAGDKTTALTAYRNGISSHLDFVNARNSDNGQTPTQITAAEKAAFLAAPAIVPATA
ncbi:MAG TPA: RagB/SusD family nutrient uptake outer membrane protein, partial [Gemmatimonadaceae bacterium]|nr:RagB/SusD family nutrient uptake outer membrane protein [Gemmatimonadaceae bacterium]